MDSLPQLLFSILSLLLVVLTLPGTCELIFLTTGALLFRNKKEELDRRCEDRLVVIIPAHNEEKGIGRTLDHLRGSDPLVEIVVIADNCEDKTADLCRAKKVRVIERKDLERRGKPYALHYGFEILLKEPIDIFFVIDADSIVTPATLPAIKSAFAQGAVAIQTRNDVKDPTNSLRHRLMNISRLGFNYVRPLGRSFWGISCGVLGNGFALRREVLQKVPFEVSRLSEDLAYHLRLVEAGIRVEFVPKAAVLSEIPASGKGAITQTVRWDGGRIQNLITELAPLLRSIFSGQARLIEPALEQLLLPLAYHVAVLLLLLLAPISIIQGYALLGIVVVSYHLSTAIYLGGGGAKDLFALILAPLYLLWKLLTLFLVIFHLKRGAEWKKTDRS